MNLRKLGTVAVVVLALGAVLAPSAFAGTPETKKASWVYTASGISPSVPVNEAIKCSKTAAAANFVLKGTVKGVEAELKATGVECVEAKLVNKAVGGVNMATAEGRIRFTGFSVVKPAGCETPSTNTSKPLVTDLLVDKTVGTKNFLKFEPVTGPTGIFNNVVLEECAQEGIYPVKGIVFTEAKGATGTHTTPQEFVGNATTHALSTLTLGEIATTLTGEISVELASGASWGVKELADPDGPPETRKASWTYTEGGVSKSLTSETVTCAKAAGPNFVLKSTIGGEVELTATGLECPEGKLVNTPVGGVNMATATGKVKFTGISVVKPAGCKTPATNTTVALNADLQMDTTFGTRSFVRVVPASGTTFTNISIEECALEGKYPLKGAYYLEAKHPTGVHTVKQVAEGNIPTHSISSLTFGSAATLTGGIEVSLSGANAGASWGAEEK